MKILHTSDWHLGHTLYNYDRTEEQRAMLNQMVDLVIEHQPDLFLLCGDIYHTSQPSSAVQTLFTEALVKIHQANPSMAIVITAGNHDSGSKHEIFRTPWRALNVYAIGNLEKTNIDEHIITIPRKGILIAVPYSHERNIPEGFFQQLINRATELNTDNLPIILSAHLTVKGCDSRGHDRVSDYSVGGIDSFDLPVMGNGFDYLALGHIHHAQSVQGGGGKVWYSGTPIPVSFDENYGHSVNLVEIQHHGDKPVVEQIPIDNPHPLVTLPTEGVVCWEEAKTLLINFPDDIAAYIRLQVQVDGFLPVEANADALQIVQSKQCKFCYIQTLRNTSSTMGGEALTVSQFQTIPPMDIAKHYLSDIGKEFDEDMEELFNETLDLVNEDLRNE